MERRWGLKLNNENEDGHEHGDGDKCLDTDNMGMDI